MKRRFILVCSLFMIMLVATGCGLDSKMVINRDYTSSQENTAYYTKAEVKEMAELSEVSFEEAAADLTKVTVNGKTYYSTTEKEDKVSAKDTKAQFAVLNSDKVVFQGQYDSSELSLEDMDFDFFNYEVTFPKKVVKTNCTLLSDKKTVRIDKDDVDSGKALYAFFNSDAAKAKKIIYNGVTKGRAYKVKKYVYIGTKNVIKKVYITRNGKKYLNDDVVTYKGKTYDNAYNRFAFTKDGKYYVKTTLINGAVASTKFTVDKTKPTTNMKAKAYKKTSKGRKITFKDATSGIKKATLNGKKIKNGKVVKKSGKYTLTIYDKAGNKRVVKFRIKKAS